MLEAAIDYNDLVGAILRQARHDFVEIPKLKGLLFKKKEWVFNDARIFFGIGNFLCEGCGQEFPASVAHTADKTVGTGTRPVYFCQKCATLYEVPSYHEHSLSFENICRLHGANPDYIRRKLNTENPNFSLKNKKRYGRINGNLS